MNGIHKCIMIRYYKSKLLIINKKGFKDWFTATVILNNRKFICLFTKNIVMVVRQNNKICKTVTCVITLNVSWLKSIRTFICICLLFTNNGVILFLHMMH